MEVSVLVIVYRGREHITLHDDHERASRALREFVDARWDDHVGEVDTNPPATADERVEWFFAGDGDLYVCGRADLSELDAHVEAAIDR